MSEQISKISTSIHEEPSLQSLEQEIISIDETLKASLAAYTLSDAQRFSNDLPETASMERLVANRAIVEKFNTDLVLENRMELFSLLDQDIANLAAKTLPIDTFKKLGVATQTPLDDMGFLCPPDMNQVLEAGLAWDLTRTNTSLEAVLAMNAETRDSKSKDQVTSALNKAQLDNVRFINALYDTNACQDPTVNR